MQALIGKKTDQTQGFLQDGTRVPLTVVSAMGNWVMQVKDNSIQLGFDIIKRPGKRELGQSKKAGLQHTPRFFREIKGDVQNVQVGSEIKATDVFKPGDIVDVSGVSKGKGFAGVVKRHHFQGGPRTHGQSDRERAPGSIGQTTTPGHVYRGKRMAGHMGHQNATVKNLEVIEVRENGEILVKGLVPGGKNSILMIKKIGENKKFIPLYKENEESTSRPVREEIKTESAPVEEVKVEEKTAEAVQPEEKKEAASAESFGEQKEVKENAG